MATRLCFFFLLPSIIIITITATSTASGATPYLSPEQAPPPFNLSSLLNTLGFHHISVAATTTTSSSNATTTIFSPTDDSLRSCPYCSLPLLLLEHSVAGLYPFSLLTTFAFGTKIQTLASTPTAPLCLTLTKSNATLFVGGVEITRPDLYNDGNLIVHGIQGFIAHLSPFSCQIERMTSLSFPSHPASISPPSTAMRGLLKEAVYHLRMRGFTILALLIQQNLDLLSQLNSMTIFAVNDAGIFADGHTFVSSFRFHVVPNRRLTGVQLINLPVDSVLITLVSGESLVVTVAGGGGPLSPMRINNVRITITDIVFNKGIVVHGIAAPLVRVHRTDNGCWPDLTDGGPTLSSERF